MSGDQRRQRVPLGGFGGNLPSHAPQGRSGMRVMRTSFFGYEKSKSAQPACSPLLVLIQPHIFAALSLFRVSGFRPRKRHLREGCGLARSWRVGVRMRERGPPRLTGAAEYIDAVKR